MISQKPAGTQQFISAQSLDMKRDNVIEPFKIEHASQNDLFSHFKENYFHWMFGLTGKY